ncbi:hypothetical protein D3C76_1560160 [compost metagenome]
MRQTAHADHLFNLEGKTQAGDLRQHRQALGALLAWPVGQASVIQGHPPLAGIQLAAHHPEQAAFARTVGTQNPKYLAGLQRQADIAQDLVRATAQGQVLDSQHQARPRNSR